MGENTPLTATGTTVRFGASRANRSTLVDQRSRDSIAPGHTAGSGSMRPAGKFKSAPPRFRCPAADFRTANRFEEAFATVIR